ncbi:MAG: hypothetical protein IPK80_26410 [Nannocystis sp.]|nr:hypothetical protein [Nannocystis sp.]
MPDTDLLLQSARILHIVAGALSLLAGGVALIARKGGAPHRRAGVVFLAAMITIALTAIVLATLRPNDFLFFLGLFSCYLALWGRVALARKRLPPRTPAPLAHSVPTALFGLTVLYFVVRAIDGALVFQIFVALALLLVIAHLRHLRRGGEYRVHWLLDHMTGFSTAYIASLTAFLVVNAPNYLPNQPLVALLVWLGPTLLGVPILRRAAARLTAPERARAAADARP